MNQLCLSAAAWDCPETAHRALAQALSFPDHYGHNLDALSDCLGDLGPTSLTITHCAQAARQMPEKWPGFVRVFQEAGEDHPALSITLVEGEEDTPDVGRTVKEALAPLLEKYQVRKTRAQKDAFLEHARGAAENLGYACQVEEHKGLLTSRNLVVGSVEKAQVVFTAHYDTCARSLVPNLVFPQCMPLTVLIQIPLILVMLVVSRAAGALMQNWTGLAIANPLTFLVLYFGLFLLLFFGKANRHTANDNTSGVAALLALMAQLPREQQEKAAFIFFDNEEYGKVGSKQYAKAHQGGLEGKVLLNLDCIGDGDYFLILAPKEADAALISKLNNAFTHAPGKTCVHRSAKNTYYNSDQMSFKNGAAVGAFHKNRLGYYLSRIHTGRDVICEESNLSYVVQGAMKLL